MNKILIATHGRLASGYKDALSILVGEVSHVTVVDAFTVDENPREKIDQFFAELQEDDRALVLTDIMFGSVNQLMAPYTERQNAFFVTGVNLPLVLELAVQFEYGTDDEQIEQTIVNARNELKNVRKAMAGITEKADEEFF